MGKAAGEAVLAVCSWGGAGGSVGAWGAVPGGGAGGGGGGRGRGRPVSGEQRGPSWVGGAQGAARAVGGAVRPALGPEELSGASRPAGHGFDSPFAQGWGAGRGASSCFGRIGLAVHGQVWPCSFKCRYPRAAVVLPSFVPPFLWVRPGSDRQEGRLAAGQAQPNTKGKRKAGVAKKGSRKEKQGCGHRWKPSP